MKNIIDAVKGSVVKIFCSYKSHNYNEPWRHPTIGSCSGSGFVVDCGGKKYIVTNAHVVENFVYADLRLADDDKRYEIEPLIIDHNCDLAFCEIKEEYEDFSKKATAAQLGKLAKNGDGVTVIGFPTGGTEVCATQGIVSRTEVEEYCHRDVAFLSHQIDAAINPGNSGGGVFNKDGAVVGVAFQGRIFAQNIGYMIPANILKHFLTECTQTMLGKHKYKGFPNLAIATKELGNKTLREFYGLKENQTGILITDIDPLSTAKGVLEKDDVIIAIGNRQVFNDGKVVLKNEHKVDFRHLLNTRYIGDKVALTILRDGKEKKVEVPLMNVYRATRKVPLALFDTPSDYIFISGMVCLQRVSANLDDIDPKSEKYNDKKNAPDEELVMITKILRCVESRGYGEFKDKIVTEINGKAIKNLLGAMEAIQTNQGKYHTIKVKSGAKMVIKNLKPQEINDILRKYEIPNASRLENNSTETMNGIYIAPLLATKNNKNTVAQQPQDSQCRKTWIEKKPGKKNKKSRVRKKYIEL